VCVCVSASDSPSTPTVWMLERSQAFQYNSAVPPRQVPQRDPVGPATPPFLLASIYGHPVPPRCSKGLLCLCSRRSSDPVTEKKRDCSCFFYPDLCDRKTSPGSSVSGQMCVCVCVCVCGVDIEKLERLKHEMESQLF